MATSRRRLARSLRDEIGEMFERVRSTRVTQIIVRPDVSMAGDCDELFVIDDGRLVEPRLGGRR